MRLAAFPFMLILCGCGLRAQPPSIQSDRPQVHVHVTEDRNSTATIEFLNLTDQPIAIGDAFGFQGVYFDVEIRRSDGSIDTSTVELFQRPRTQCIAPGHAHRMTVSLRHPLRL